MIIKVCGMRDAGNIRAAAALDIDMMGHVFWPKSSRYVPIESTLPTPDATGNVKRVGVFVDETPQNIIAYAYRFRLDGIQLHGHESRIYVENLRKTLEPDIVSRLTILKAISIGVPEDIAKCRAYDGVVDLFLFDTKCATMGGSSRKFDWRVLSLYEGQTPFLLSGGIGPDDAEAIRAIEHPQFAGVDLNSRFEISPALKDITKLQTFIQAIRK